MMRTMPRRRKKSRKLRGHRLHGYGQQRQHRRSGRQGGFGKAGVKKHLWTWITAYEPDYFGRGRRGFKRPRAVVREVRTVNVGELERMLPNLMSLGYARETEKGIEIDLSEAGYDKLLGRGSVTKPLLVKIDLATEMAVRKLEEAGGAVLTESESE
ncbi:MAG: uL15 family ribosomal protein [Candidatus Korarchaeota archaeon]|nr:uL15 family ribosomal protein [Candidatus Korarchaeota archaeon]